MENEYYGSNNLHADNDQGLHISHAGVVNVSSSKGSLVLNNILSIPSIFKIFLSIQKFSTDNNYFFDF